MEKYSNIPVSKLASEGPMREQDILDSQDPKQIYFYAAEVKKGRWPEAEPILLTHPYWAYVYANNILKSRWPEAEPMIIDCPQTAYKYARDVIKGRWPEAEDSLITTPSAAYRYFMEALKGQRFPKGEKVLKDHPVYWESYLDTLKESEQAVDLWKSEEGWE